MRAMVLLILSLLAFNASAEGKIIQLGKLTIECFVSNCEEKIKEIDDHVVKNDSPELGIITTIVFADWWSKPTVKGRTIINAGDTARVILSYLGRHGMAARSAMFDAQEIGEQLRTKYQVDVNCESRTVAVRCAEVVKQIRETAEMAAKENLKLAPQTIDIYAIDWEAGNNVPKATLLGQLKDGKRYRTNAVLTTKELYKELKDQSALVSLENI